MSSKGYATPLRINATSLPMLRRLYLGFASLVSVMLLLLPLAPWLTFLLLVGFVATARLVWLKRCELAGSTVELLWDAQQRWWWTQDNREYLLELCSDSFLSRRFCILNFHDAARKRRHSVVLMPEGSGSRCYRQLLVRFRTGGAAAGEKRDAISG